MNLSKLMGTLPWQFKNKPATEALRLALEAETVELQEMFLQLNEARTFQKSDGQQLDGIGDIVVLTRADAGLLSGKRKGKINFPVIDDGRYRKYLRYKVLKNTSICTYRDVVTAVRMIYEREPVKVLENKDGPATLRVSFPLYGTEDEEELDEVPPVKAAGVGIRVYGETEQEIRSQIWVGAATIKGADVSIYPVPVSVTTSQPLYVGARTISETQAMIKPREINLRFRQNIFAGGGAFEESHITVIPKPPAEIRLPPVYVGAGIVCETRTKVGHMEE